MKSRKYRDRKQQEKRADQADNHQEKAAGGASESKAADSRLPEKQAEEKQSPEKAVTGSRPPEKQAEEKQSPEKTGTGKKAREKRTSGKRAAESREADSPAGESQKPGKGKKRNRKFPGYRFRRRHYVQVRKVLTIVALVLDFVIILIFGAGFYNMHRKMDQLSYELSYLSDNNQVLINSVNDMKSDIESTLQQEASVLESWNIQLKDMDFADNTYTVSVQVVPKEYTENTKAAIYFGTREFPLKLNGYCYVGEAELTLEEAYDGNVTVLFVDGTSRKTEVLSDYSDVRTDLTNVLYGETYEDPQYEDGCLKLNGTGYVELDGGDFFLFDALSLVVEADGEEVKSYNLAAMAAGESVEEAAKNTAESKEAGSSLTQEVLQADLFGTSSGNEAEDETETAVSRNHVTMPTAWLSYTYTLADEVEITPGSHVRIYLKAITENNFEFTYDLFSCDIDAEETEGGQGLISDNNETADQEKPVTGEMNEESIDLTNYAAVYDSGGGCYRIR